MKNKMNRISVGVLAGAVALCVSAVFYVSGQITFGFNGYVVLYTDIIYNKLVITSGDNAQSTSVNHPVDEYSSAFDFDDFSVLVGGRLASGKGRIARYTRNGQGVFSLAETFDWTNGNPISLAYRPDQGASGSGILYYLDLVAREIRYSPYSPGSALPTSWLVLANQASLSLLGSQDLADYVLTYGSSLDRLLIGMNDGYDGAMAWIDPTSGSSQAADGWSLWPAIDDSGTGMDVGSASVPIESTTDSVQIIRFLTESTWDVIGFSPSGASPIAVTPLAYGDIVAAKRSGLPLPAPPWVVAVGRDGVAESLDAFSTIRPLAREIGLGCFPGSDAFSVSVWLDHVDRDNVVSPAAYSAMLVVGTPADIAVYNGRYFLNSLYMVPATIDVWTKKRAGFGSVDLPIDNDTNLVGLVFSFQYWVDNGTEARLSDIVSVVVRADEFDGPDPNTMLVPGPSRGARSSGGSARVTLRNWSPATRISAMRSLLKGRKVDAATASKWRIRLRR